MIDLYYWTTPNNHKLTMFLEEAGLPYTMKPVNLQKGEQSAPDYLKINPNGRTPALVDHEPVGGGGPLSVFDSGAMLVYLAEKTGKLLPRAPRAKAAVLEWLFWEVTGLSPMAGQLGFFKRAQEQVPFAIDRYKKETTRLYGVLDRHLAGKTFLANGEYSIADITTFPWAAPYTMFEIDIDAFPNVERWLDAIAARPATQRAYAIAKELNPEAPLPPGSRKK
jgi:GSH-dependent disulfide-bond oxidoreductase